MLLFLKPDQDSRTFNYLFFFAMEIYGCVGWRQEGAVGEIMEVVCVPRGGRRGHTVCVSVWMECAWSLLLYASK